MSTRKDVAKLAGVSVATVSYVLNNTKHVTPEVHKRVMDAVRELDYSPNLVAKSLATRQTRHVAMLVDNLKNPYYCELLEGIQELAARNGYIVSVVLVDVAKRKSILELAARGVDGIILALGTHDVREYVGKNIPLSFAGKRVVLDYQEAVLQMVQCLKSHGHTKIAFLSGFSSSDPSNERYFCLEKAMRQEGLVLDPDLIVEGQPFGRTDEQEGKRAVEELLGRKKEFTALFAINDLMALGAYRGLREAGYTVPEDISLVGCDAVRLMEMMSPSLSTLDTHAFETGQALMEALILEIFPERDVEKKSWKIPVTFVPGESIGVARTKKQ